MEAGWRLSLHTQALDLVREIAARQPEPPRRLRLDAAGGVQGPPDQSRLDVGQLVAQINAGRQARQPTPQRIVARPGRARGARYVFVDL